MKKLIILLALLLSSICNADEITVADFDNTYTLFINTYTGDGISTYPMGKWNSIDVSEYVSDNATAIFLSGILIITHGVTPECADLRVYFRKPGSSRHAFGQVIEASIANGQRSTYSTWVPIENGIFEFQWWVPVLSIWPTYSAYGINLLMESYTHE